MMKTIHGFFIMVAWFAVFPAVVNLSGSWQSQAYPTPGVQVDFKNGSSAVGMLSREWGGRWILTTPAGESRSFGEGEYRAISYPAPDASTAAPQWRALVPPLTTGFLFLLATLWPWFQPKQHEHGKTS